MRCNNELSLIHFRKQITNYCIASVNYERIFKSRNSIISVLIFNKILLIESEIEKIKKARVLTRAFE
jgi:hypothetical protein